MTAFAKPDYVGIPFAFNCDDCVTAVICPACGIHLVEVERKDEESYSGREYAQHWLATHPNLESQNLGGTLWIVKPSGATVTYHKEALDGCPAFATQLLKEAEWHQPRSNARASCPICDGYEPDHAPDCALARYLKGRS